MKKQTVGALTALLLLSPQSLRAEEISLRHTLPGNERIGALWVLGLCAATFLTLVCIWSVNLKRSQNKERGRAASGRIRK